MVEWKKRLITGFTVVPAVLLITNYNFLFHFLIQGTTYLAMTEYKKLIQHIMKLHSSESEHDYINRLASSAKTTASWHILLFGVHYFNSESALHVILLLLIALNCLGRVFDFLNFLKVVAKKESLQQDPVLDRKVFVLTFLQMGADALGMILFVYSMSFTLLMNNATDRIPLLVLWFLTAWQTDNGALFLGALIGKNPFSPQVSPKKTWEGVAGGIFLCVFSSFVISLFANEHSFYIPNWPTKHYLIVSLIVAFVSLLGDYLESFIKRAANAKDSGAILPGHGGMLDRFDSLAITAPVIYFYSKLI